MSATRRTVRVPGPDGRSVEQTAVEVPAMWRADRNDRLRRASIDAKQIARSERYSARRDSEPVYHVGSSVRAVA